MGWASGSGLFEEIIKASKKVMPNAALRKSFYLKVIKAFEDYDWDTQDECLNKDVAFKEALKELHPDWEIK